MNDTALHALLRRFRRQILLIRTIYVAFGLFFVVAILWSATQPEPNGRQAVFLLSMAAIVGWVILILTSVRHMREVQTGTILLTAGQLDDAEVWIRRSIERFSLSARAKMLAGQQLASLFFRRNAHERVVAVCTELLRHRISRLRHVWINTRLMLADSLLTLDRVAEAYEAIRPIYAAPLTLIERMKLLPIELRYELASNHTASAVQRLPEKIRIAELLDSQRAALVHALLAEACRRESMTSEHEYLARRARLYHDLDDLAAKYTVIGPIACETAASEPKDDTPSGASESETHPSS